MINSKIQLALERDRTIDITTTGRRSGKPRRIEIWFHNLNGRLFIAGSPGRRDWYANLRANPQFIFHLKGSVQADLAARARPIQEEAERRQVLSGIFRSLGRDGSELEQWVAESPLVEVDDLS